MRPRTFACALGLLALCGAFLFFYRLGDRDLWSSHEGRAAQDAESVLADGLASVPRLFDGHLDLQKPPLYYWLVAAAARLRGTAVDTWTVRLPAALAGWLGVLGIAALLAWRGRPVAALVAALMLATALHYTWLARVGRIDMPLTLAVGVALGCFYLASGGRKPPEEVAPTVDATSSGGLRPPLAFVFHLMAYVSVAVAILLKGPIGAVLPAIVWTAHLTVEGRWRPRWRTSLWWGVPLVLLLTVPWFWWANSQTHGEFFRVFFWRHNVERGFGDDDGTGAMHSRPWWLYGAHLFGDLLPWSLLLPLALWYMFRGGRWRDDPEARFGLVWLLSITLLLSCLRFKRGDYLLPAYPGAAMFLGCAAERCWQSAVHPRRWASAFAAVIAVCLGGWWYYLDVELPRQEPERDLRPFAAEVRRRVPPPQGVLFFRTEVHALAFHLGPPLNTFLEWENLDVWAGRPGCHYILMSREAADVWHKHVTSGRLVEVLSTTYLNGDRFRELVLMRTDHGTEKSSR